jgi:hypothetical protein
MIGLSKDSVKKLDMTNKELFLTFFEVESATIIGIKYRNIDKIQLILNPTERNKFMDKLPIRLLIDREYGYYSRVMGTSDKMFNLFTYLGLNTKEIISICREIHEDMGSRELIVP